MKKNVLIVLLALFSVGFTYGQVFLDQFEADQGNIMSTTGYTLDVNDSQLTISGDGTADAFGNITIALTNEDGSQATVDMTGNNEIFVRAKASSIGTQFRMDVIDVNGYMSTIDNVTRTLLNDFEEISFAYTAYQDGGYGGTACDATDAPCPVDGTQIQSVIIYINPGQGGFQGTVIMDYVSFGEKPSVIPMSDVYQDQFEGEMIDSFLSFGEGYFGDVTDGIWTINGDGTAGQYNPMVYFVHNMVTNDSSDLDLTLGNNEIYIRAKGSVPGIALRCDAQDIDGFITTAGSVTKILSDEWQTYKYDLTGFYNDLGYGGTPCDQVTAPCPVDATRVGNFTFFINPGVDAFSEQVQIEYISIGTALEAEDPTQNVLVYGDHFNDGILYSSSDFYTIEETNSTITVAGDGSAGQYTAVAYSPFDATSGETIAIDVTGNNKIFLKGSSTIENTLVRMDLIDADGYITSLPALTNVFGLDEVVREYDFSSVYSDGGYGGTPCDAADAPCAVNGAEIVTVLLYPNPVDGGFAGTLTFDYISTGAPLGDDIVQYSDQFENDLNVVTDPGGFTSSEANGELTLTGDGTAGAYAAYAYDLHDQEAGTTVLADFTSNNKLFVKAKSSVGGAVLRIDVIDEDGYVGNLNAVAFSLTDEYELYEFDFSNAYQDGAYGGTPCTAGPCDVDGKRVNALLLYIDPDLGGFSGDVTIDWISTITPLENVGDPGPVGQNEYADAFVNDNSTNIVGADGLAIVENGGLLTITGDGTSGQFTPVVYTFHDQDDETTVLVNGEPNENKVFIRANSTIADLPLRVDVQDNEGYVTSLASLTQNLQLDFAIYEFDYTGGYQDGGFGGTPCNAGPCSVDAQRLAAMQLFILPGVGEFQGEVNIDWISFGEPLIIAVEDYEDVLQARIFPNPASSIITIDAEFKSNLDQVTISIFDVTGRLLKQTSSGLQGAKLFENIDLEGINSGVYYIQVSSANSTLFSEKLMIK